MPPKPQQHEAMVSQYFDYSSSAMADGSATSRQSLQEENEALRRQLLEAQELLVKRNAQLATLEGEMQSLEESRTSPQSSRKSNRKEVVIVSNMPRVIGEAESNVDSDDATAPGSSAGSSYNTPAFGLLVQQLPMRSIINDHCSLDNDTAGNTCHSADASTSADTPSAFDEAQANEWTNETSVDRKATPTTMATTTTTTSAVDSHHPWDVFVPPRTITETVAVRDRKATPTTMATTTTTTSAADSHHHDVFVPPRMITETVPVRSLGVDKRLFQVELDHRHDDADLLKRDSLTTLTIDTDLTSTPSMNDLVPKIASMAKPLPLAISPSHTKDTESLSAFSEEEDERSFWDESVTLDTVTPSMSASNHRRKTQSKVASKHDKEEEEEEPSTPTSPLQRDPTYVDPFGTEHYSSMASSTIYTTTADKPNSFSKPPLAPRTTRSGRIQAATSSSQRLLPRELELDGAKKQQAASSTIQVTNYKLIDADSDEGVYTGSLHAKSKLPHGKGGMVYDEYRFYDGDWNQGRWHGQGHVQSRVMEYHGAFRNDQKHGRGVLKHVDGSTFEGLFRHDEKHGQGKLVYRNGITFFGQFKHGKKSGWGLQLRADGSTDHEGMFLNDEPIRGYDEQQLQKLSKFASTMIEI